MFGRRKRHKGADESATDVVAAGHDEPVEDGPYDYEDVSEQLDEIAKERLDLGSVIVPVPAGGQLQVEMGPDGKPAGVHLVTEHGRVTVAAYAAPKSPGQWRDVVGDLTTSLKGDNNSATIETGPWGRELVTSTPQADMRFIGVDGYRWMVRLVAAGPKGSADDGSPLVTAARDILRQTVVRRGTDPYPVRTALPVQLPKQLAEQLAAAHQQQLAAQQAAQAASNTPVAPQQAPPPPRPPRRGADGSAMQQLRK
ncbi:DUF3710 domain-containing protein [Antrihabitans sp. YC2-6]|uniref:DUF3710 domain-containing protein n=1 Tax=Antrihabitans sp. YC2-6 TaxID=2799498 RepID=UPI0018F468CC|nr:DUF3710 domain-containing protein [Antrihabitans sp. YC2-6]MBJ8345071.1 DUF3710 domain-containing protein [Antrihabitans sp. YC2-6]